MADASTTTTRYHALDLWRGVVCLFVVAEHAAVALWHGQAKVGPSWESTIQRWILAPFLTNLGTPLFFVMSGFCIAASLVSHRRKGGHPFAFLAKRMWRVFPPYWIALLGFAAIVTVLDLSGLSHWHRGPYGLELASINELSTAQWFGNFTLTETWRPLAFGEDPHVFTRVAWSLCYQEQFYLVCFFTLMLARKSLFKTLLIASIAIIGLRVIAGDVGRLPHLQGTFPMLWHEFAIGLAVFWRLNGALRRKDRHLVELGLACAACLGYWNETPTMVVASLFGLALIGFHRFDAVWATISSLNRLRSVGRCSYGIYLTHLPVVVVIAALLAELGVTTFWGRALITVPISLIVSVAVGMAFSRLVETRFSNLPNWKGRTSPVLKPSRGLAGARVS